MSESDPNPTPAAPRIRRPRATAAAPDATAAPQPPAPATEDGTPVSTSPTTAFVPPTSYPGVAFGTAASQPAPPAARAPRRTIAPLVAALAAGAVLGGASGAGIAVWAISENGPAQVDVAGPSTITVNDPESVNVVTAVAQKAGPSVVTIAVSSTGSAGTGSGVILSSDGYILTNNHVVTLDGASSDGTIEVTTADGHIYSAEIVGTDPIVDLAVIKVSGVTGLTPIEFGDVDALDVGDRVVAIGAPLGLANTVTDGIVSALDRSIQIASSAVPDDGTEGDDGQGPYNFDLPGQPGSGAASGTISLPVIQTDAAINPGNSGGALVDDQGRLIGINVAIASAGGGSGQSGSIGVGFAIPAELAKRVATELIENGTATHGLLGATVRDASSADGSVVGAVIDGVTDGGAAAAVGLRKGDVVTEFDGTPITGSVDLTAQVRSHPSGATVDLTYVRDGEERTATVTLGQLGG